MTVPDPIRAVFDSLQFEEPRPEALAGLTAGDWKDALEFCDRNHLTLLLLQRCRESLPAAIRDRLTDNAAANERRVLQLLAAYREAAEVLRHAGVPFVVLKGFSHCPWFAPEPTLRPQYDIDIYCPPQQVLLARDELLAAGYESLRGYERQPTDHLPILMRPTDWEWHGDYFDDSIPARIELHMRFWDKGTELFEPEGLEEFWARRVTETLEHLSYPALQEADRLGYACLHLLRHVLRGDVKPYHAYEIARFLGLRANDSEFWATWRGLHGESLRRLEATVFGLCSRWFNCRLHDAAAEEVAALPAAIRNWMEIYGFAPMEGLVTPNKHELWLHMTLVESPRGRASILIRRLLPTTLPGPVAANYGRFIAGRFLHHARTLPPALAHGTAWYFRSAGIDPGFIRFLSGAWLYELGMFIFVLLYNLHLLDLGYREDFIGLVTGTQTAGTLAGALPAGVLVRRWGMRRLLCTAFLLLSSVFALRSLVTERMPLLASAFAGGVVMSAFMVAFAPAVARLTGEESRPLGYGIFFSSGIAMGIAGGLVGGHLPDWLSGFSLPGKQAGLFVACALIACAALPSFGLRLPPEGGEAGRVYPRSPLLWRFLAAIALWSLAMGLFNPFFNTYFAHHLNVGVGQVGTVFSIGQVSQVAAMLTAPWILRRIGLVPGIAWMQAAAGVSLAILAVCAAPGPATVIYVSFMAFQWMSEPGMYSVLMKSLKPSEMGTAAALNMTVIGLAQVVAAPVAGMAIDRLGYPPVVGSAGLLAVVAAVLFWALLRRIVYSNSAST